MEAKMVKALSSINSTFDNWIINNIFEEINLEHAKISSQLSYLIKLHFKVIIPKVNCNQALEKCIENLSILLRSANEKQKIHNLHLFKYLLRKYLRITDKQLQYTNPDSSEIVECNQKNYYPKGFNLQEFSKIERAYLDSQKLNEWMVDIVNSDIRLPNNECVCCTELFIHKFQIRNNNPLFPHVIGLRENESEDFNLERYICAICNSGGGVLVIGAETNNSRVWATGVNFKSAYDVQEKQNQLLRSGMYIKPEFEFSVDKLRVHSNFLDQGQNIMKEQNRFCFRIKILPRQINKKHYIQIFNKGYHNLYETYQLDQNLNYFRVDSDESNPSQTDKLFFLIQECYRSKKNAKISSHKGIKCCQPYNFPSKLFTKNLSQNNPKVQKVQDKEKNDNYSDKDEPTFKYTYTSILAVGSKKKDKYIHDLVTFMKKKKMLFRVENPFQHSFKEGPRSIWMFSHNDRHDFLKNCIKECDKTGSITMIPVYKTLQIDKCRVSEQCRLEIQNKFIKRYPEGFRTEEIIAEDEHGIIRQPLIMLFNSFIHAIYAYMIFESMQLRPYFVKQNTLYKKKSKFKENELNWI